MNIWKAIEGFSPDEKWGTPEKMNGLLLMLLSAVKKEFGCSVVIHEGYKSSGHADKSQHYLGNASDFHLNWKDPKDALPYSRQVEKMITLLTDLQVAHKVGLGIYPDWNSPGFHLDVRGCMARWGKINKKDDYVAFNVALNYIKEKEAAQ